MFPGPDGMKLGWFEEKGDKSCGRQSSLELKVVIGSLAASPARRTGSALRISLAFTAIVYSLAKEVRYHVVGILNHVSKCWIEITDGTIDTYPAIRASGHGGPAHSPANFVVRGIQSSLGSGNLGVMRRRLRDLDTKAKDSSAKLLIHEKQRNSDKDTILIVRGRLVLEMTYVMSSLDLPEDQGMAAMPVAKK